MGKLMFNGVNYTGGGGSGASSISQLSDVNITNIQNGQILKYDSNNHEFINADETGGGGGTVLTGTLEAGHTSITFTNSAIGVNSMIDVQTSILGVCPIGADDSTVGTVTFYFNSQSVDMGVKVVIT